MKRRIKGLIKTICLTMVMTIAMSFPVFAESSIPQEEKDYYSEQAKVLVESLSGMTDEDMVMYLAQKDAFTTSAVESWKSVKEELGDYQEVISQSVEEKGEDVVVTTKAKYTNHAATITLVLNLTDQVPYQSMTFDVAYSMAVTLERAGLNTLMGLGIVFFMLVFLSIIIGQFKHINAWEKKRAEKSKPVEILAAPVAVPQVEAVEEVDDGELVAVIAAAIAAAENTSTDGFVVRSIKKANHKKWQRA